MASTSWENIYFFKKTETRSIFLLDKEILEINKGNTTPLENWAKDMNRLFTEGKLHVGQYTYFLNKPHLCRLAK